MAAIFDISNTARYFLRPVTPSKSCLARTAQFVYTFGVYDYEASIIVIAIDEDISTAISVLGFP